MFTNCDTGVLLQSSDHSGGSVNTGRDDNSILSQMNILQLGKNITKEQIQPGAERFKTAGENFYSETLSFISHHVDATWLENTDVQTPRPENSSPALNTQCSGLPGPSPASIMLAASP